MKNTERTQRNDQSQTIGYLHFIFVLNKLEVMKSRKYRAHTHTHPRTLSHDTQAYRAVWFTRDNFPPFEMIYTLNRFAFRYALPDVRLIASNITKKKKNESNYNYGMSRTVITS